MPDVDLTTLDGLLAAVAAYEDARARSRPATLESSSRRPSIPVNDSPTADDELGEFTGTYCVTCAGSRRMRLVARDDRCGELNPMKLARTRELLEQMDGERDPLAFSIGIAPPVFTAECLQCKQTIALVVEAGPPTEVIVLGGRARGLSTTNTPEAVTFYLDQAYRSRTNGAYTAATTMYRAALEQFLNDQGFTTGTLAARIQVAVAAAPTWVQQLDAVLMHALRALGNRAAHGTAVPTSEQAAWDRQLVRDAELLFIDVLDEVYEVPARRDERRRRVLEARQGGQPGDDPQ